MTNQEIDAVLVTISKRPQAWYDKVNELVAQGYTFRHATAEWVRKDERCRICFTADRAWIRHPHQEVCK